MHHPAYILVRLLRYTLIVGGSPMARRTFSGRRKTITRAGRGTSIQRSRAVPPAEKAAFHQVTGAGRSRIMRPFLGLTDADEDAIVTRFSDGLDRLLQRGR